MQIRKASLTGLKRNPKHKGVAIQGIKQRAKNLDGEFCHNVGMAFDPARHLFFDLTGNVSGSADAGTNEVVGVAGMPVSACNNRASAMSLSLKSLPDNDTACTKADLMELWSQKEARSIAGVFFEIVIFCEFATCVFQQTAHHACAGQNGECEDDNVAGEDTADDATAAAETSIISHQKPATVSDDPSDEESA